MPVSESAETVDVVVLIPSPYMVILPVYTENFRGDSIYRLSGDQITTFTVCDLLSPHVRRILSESEWWRD